MNRILRILKYRKNIIAFFLVFVFVMQIISMSDVACASGKVSTKKVIRFASNKDVGMLEKYKYAFEKEHPDVTIELEAPSDYENVTMEQIKSGNAPDVLFIPGILQQKDYDKYLLPLGKKKDLQRKYDYMDDAAAIGQNVYGLPSSMYLSGFVYNKKVFEDAGISQLPNTIEEFMQDLKYIKEYTDAIPFYSGYSSEWMLMVWESFPFIEMTGDQFYKTKEFTTIKNPFQSESTHHTVYSMLYDIVERGYCEKKLDEYSWNQAIKDLNEGRLGCMALGSWGISTVRDAGKFKDSIGYMAFPNRVSGKKHATLMSDYKYGVSRTSKYPEEAKEFVRYMLEDSGYTADFQYVSIVRDKEFPDTYSNLDDVIFEENNTSSEEDSYKLAILSKNLDLFSGKQQKRIIAAAAGKTNETLEEILEDWNKKWEANRTKDMELKRPEDIYSLQRNVADGKTRFSDPEKKYLKTQKQLKIGILTNMPPFQYVEDNKIRGMSKLVCDDVTEQMGVKPIYKKFNDTDSMLRALQQGKIDVIAGIEDISQYSDVFKTSKMYIEYNNVIVKNKMLTVEKNGNLDLTNKTASVVKDNVHDYYKGIKKQRTYNDISEAIKNVDFGVTQYTITNYYTANYCIKKYKYDSVDIVPTIKKNQLHAAFSKNSDPRLVSIYNKCLGRIGDTKLSTYLLNGSDNGKSTVDLKNLVERYPFQCTMLILFVCVLVMMEIWLTSYEKQKYLKRQELYAKRYALLAEMMDEYIFEYEVCRRILQVDEKFQEYFNCDAKLKLEDYDRSNEKINQFLDTLKAMIENDESEKRLYFGDLADGNTEWFRIYISFIKTKEDDKPCRIIGKISNVQSEMEERMAFLKKTAVDSLTEVYNRSGFTENYKAQFNTNKKYQKSVVGILDFDNFKLVNDTLGHLGGDEALKMLANEIRKTMTGVGLFARYGGDEFVFYIPDGRDSEKIESILQDLVERMNTKLKFDNNAVELSISLGAIIVPSDMDLSEAIELADQQLYKVKENSKNGYKLTKYTA